ncbi:uncharacterized protein IAS62_002185 [Cryptococcus decagattii]|uniref:Uncharacterized protein n=1 Tax=Cryptococcus decagattii TaxID=1859122 RepID=A0ABZ2AQU6_9TREE
MNVRQRYQETLSAEILEKYFADFVATFVRGKNVV